jgi:hypothetical protein
MILLINSDRNLKGQNIQLIGEESGDQWKLYVQSGHHQLLKTSIVFPEFDKAKLYKKFKNK